LADAYFTQPAARGNPAAPQLVRPGACLRNVTGPLLSHNGS
jgi:hypothetical protein